MPTIAYRMMELRESAIDSKIKRWKFHKEHSLKYFPPNYWLITKSKIIVTLFGAKQNCVLLKSCMEDKDHIEGTSVKKAWPKSTYENTYDKLKLRVIL